MKIVIACGNPGSDLDAVFSLLQQAGVQPARAAENAAKTEIQAWHERLLARHSDLPAQEITQPGRAWEHAASDIFLANWEKPVWGWADVRSTWLLNFWRDFDPQTRFVLVHTSPVGALSHAIAMSNGNGFDAHRMIAHWLAYTSEMLRFYNRNRDRCLLVDAQDALQNAGRFIEAVAGHLEVDLDAEEISVSPEAAPSPLALILAEELLLDFPEVETLRQEVAATQALFAAAGASVAAVARQDRLAVVDGAIAQLRELIQASGPALHDLRGNYERLQNDKAAQLMALRDAEARLEALVAEHSSQRTMAAALEARKQALEKENAELVKARDAQAKLAKDLQIQLEAANKRVQDAVAQKNEQAEKELRQENELLLLQLHQVQEELEHYFLQHQDLLKKQKEQEARWERILLRHPDYCDWEAIEPTDVADADAGAAVTWRIKGLAVGNRLLPEFQVTTQIQNGNPALVFSRQKDTDPTPFLHWPTGRKDGVAFLQPRGPESDRSQRWNALWSLATSDWQFIQTLCAALTEYLRTGNQSSDGKVKVDASAWISRLESLKEQFGLLPPSWRYDKLRLKREQVNPDYEHLWLVMENAQFGDRRWSSFEFRVGASLVKPGAFSVHPKLEFPQGEDGQKQFEKWFAETQDDFGPKFELRFELNSQAMDLSAWKALSPSDQAQLLSIVGHLPSALAMLENGDARISRAWNDWQRLVAGMIKVMKSRLAQVPHKVVAQATPVAPVKAPAPMPASAQVPSATAKVDADRKTSRQRKKNVNTTVETA